MDKKIVTAVRQFSASVGRGDGTRRRLMQRVAEYVEVPARRDGRGVEAKVLKEVRTTLKHLNGAAKWQDDGHLDANVRRQARAVARTASHAQVPFEELMAPASKLRGDVNKAGKKRNDRKPIDGCDPLRMGLPKGFAVERLCTKAALAGAGRALGNCARDNRFGLHDKLLQRESDFYLVWDRDSQAVAMCEVDLETDEIVEFLGKGNSNVRLPHCALIAMLSGLEVGGDDVRTCLQPGAVSIFATGAASLKAPDYRRGRLRVWAVKGQLVVQKRKRRGRKWRGQWSSFRWNGADWEAADASYLHRLDGLMTKHRRVAKLARKAAT